ncbi:MAG: phospholipase D-like domain-containing protein [Polyangiales bacterium]
MDFALSPGRHVWRRHAVDEVGLLIDAEDYYRAFYRAALTAQRRLLISGWQFDSDVALLRGREAEQAPAPVELLKFLNHLCETRPALEIRLLAWDFHMVFAIEREWMQKLVFHWTTHERLKFKFDDSHVDGGSHHQKFVVVDDQVSFLGGLDLCDHRWDDNHHANKNPLRVSRGSPHKPFHDIQVYMRGREVTASLSELFYDRWHKAGGDALPEPTPVEAGEASEVQGLIALPSAEVTLSRTDPNGSPGGPSPCSEIRDLYTDALQAARQLVYIETQYFSGHAVVDALERRLHASAQPPLEIVLIINMKAETLMEQAAVGLAQAGQLDRLRKLAQNTGHHLGIYYTLPACAPGESPEQATYIHSKLMIVDDVLLTVGSANLTNRSLAADTELNCNLLAETSAAPLGQAIQQLRGHLLGEHTGGPDILVSQGLVAHLDNLATRAANGEADVPCRLRLHPSPTSEEQTALTLIDPQALPFDPDDKDLLEEQRSIFRDGFGDAIRRLIGMEPDRG